MQVRNSFSNAGSWVFAVNAKEEASICGMKPSTLLVLHAPIEAEMVNWVLNSSEATSWDWLLIMLESFDGLQVETQLVRHHWVAQVTTRLPHGRRPWDLSQPLPALGSALPKLFLQSRSWGKRQISTTSEGVVDMGLSVTQGGVGVRFKDTCSKNFWEGYREGVSGEACVKLCHLGILLCCFQFCFL